MIANQSIEVSVPASIMLLGEHAVLYGSPAVVCAVDYRMDLSLSPREDEKILIRSAALGRLETSLVQLQVEPPFRFVLTAIQYYQNLLHRGFELDIKAHFSHEVGLGSSAAVTVAIVKALRIYLGLSVDHLLLYQEALAIVRQVQGIGSGADLAASVYGGVLAYAINPLRIESLPTVPHLNLFYSGSKMPTVQVLEQVKKAFENRPQALNKIYQEIAQMSETGILAIKNQDWPMLGQCFNEQQKAMTALGVTNEALQNYLDKLSKEKKVLGAKISGSGLGDCIVALGDLDHSELVRDPGYIRVAVYG